MSRVARVAVLILPLSIACAQGGTDPGVGRDNCRVRDCGPTSGGEADPLPEEDFGIIEDPDLGFIEDFGTPEDTYREKDTGVVDTGPEIAPDTGGCAADVGASCTTFPQCGCSSTNNCDVTAVDTGKTSCVALGTRKVHEKCKLGECAKGLSCLAGLCVPFCSGTSDCADVPSSVCRNVQYNTGTALKDSPGYKVCMAQCDPRVPSTYCGAANACEIVDGTVGSTLCRSAGTATTKGACTTDNSLCAPGYTCVDPGDCLRWCRVGYPGDCPAALKCYTFSDPLKIKTIEYGVCDL